MNDLTGHESERADRVLAAVPVLAELERERARWPASNAEPFDWCVETSACAANALAVAAPLVRPDVKGHAFWAAMLRRRLLLVALNAIRGIEAIDRAYGPLE